MQVTTSEKLANQSLQRSFEKRPKAKPKAVKPSLQAGRSYHASLQRIVREVKRDIDDQIVPIIRSLQSQYTGDAWIDDIAAVIERVKAKWGTSPAFQQLAATISRSFVQGSASLNSNRFNQSMKSVGIDVYGNSQHLDDLLQAAAYDNAQLIKSIPQQYLGRVESIVVGNMRDGNRPSSIVDELQKQFGINQRRAAFIARDQTAKINGQMTAARQQAVGFEYFQWQTSEDERVRDRHEKIANKLTAYGRGIYRYDNPPLSESGEPILFGQDYNCRCNGTPISNAQVKENQRNGKVAPGVYR